MRRAPLLDLSLELPRTWAAHAQLAVSRTRLSRVSRGDGHPVLVLPGFLASDLSTVPLRRYLARLGYSAYGWGLGRNLGATGSLLTGLARLLDRIRTSHQETVSLVGWSLGGVFARELARRSPAAIRQVISLGSPFNGDGIPGLVASSEPLGVPSTAVYTRTDGIVDWRATVQRPDQRSENVEVRGSHCGLGVNPAVLLVVADRLALPEGAWTAFRAPAELRHWYPRAWPGPADGPVPVTLIPEERSWIA
jgi:pimeloyl-ACP methyl ester carboxylesterase